MTTAAIDRDIWMPFTAAYPALDADLAGSVYSPDLIRGGGPERTVTDLATHLGDFRVFFDFVRGQGDSLSIEFRFTERLIGEGVATERGVFRIDVRLSSGEHRQTYGRFHVFERVEHGVWRIVTDYDEPGASADEFETATPIGG